MGNILYRKCNARAFAFDAVVESVGRNDLPTLRTQLDADPEIVHPSRRGNLLAIVVVEGNISLMEEVLRVARCD